MDVERSKPRILTLAQWIWAITAVIGACIFIATGLNTYRMLVCNDWPVTDGVITRSELKRGLMREGALKFQLHLAYQYRVDGQTYSGKRICFGDPSGRREDINALLSTYPKGRKIQVYYFPNNPKVATLETDVSWKGSKFLIGGLLMIGIGLTGIRQRWSLQTDYLFKEQDPDQHVPKWKIVAGSVGLLACLGLFWLWWELIKMYAGR
ncbi:MAG: DUF3592 domain-containing protein [Desulfobacteraceae bacterium]|jgi:hypothetical protein